jgi:hypothetical protein
LAYFENQVTADSALQRAASVADKLFAPVADGKAAVRIRKKEEK